VEHAKTEVDERCCHRLTIHGEVLLVEVPGAGTDHERGGEGRRGQFAAVGLGDIGLALEQVVERRGGCIFEIGHEHIGTAVERLNHEVTGNRAGDLGSTVGEVGGSTRDRPAARADVGGVGAELGTKAVIDASLALDASLEKPAASRLEHRVQGAEECECLVGEQRGGQRVCSRRGVRNGGSDSRVSGRSGQCHRHSSSLDRRMGSLNQVWAFL